jgi:hypothetical protein
MRGNSERNFPMRTEDAFPGKYLKSSDAKPKPLVAVISHVEMEMVGQGQDQKRKPVLHLEDQKPLVLNRTNFEALVDAFGDSDDWPGHKIKIYCVKTQYAGKSVDGLRIEPDCPPAGAR